MLTKINPKKILSYVLLGVLVVFIVVLTWVPLIFDIEHLNVNKWITNSLISVGIMIGGIILGEIFGEDKQKEKVKGLFQIALKAYNDTLQRITQSHIVVFFSQWYIWFKANELQRKKIGFLVDHGFDQQVAEHIVKYIDREEVDLMKSKVYIKTLEDGETIKFKRLREEEYELVQEIYSPDFTIDAPKYTYYLSAFGDSSSVSTLEEAKRIEKKEHLNKTFNRTFKIVVSLFISFIWGMATIEELTEGRMKEAIANTFWRMVALISGLLGGFLTSVVAVKLASQKLDNKTQVLTFMEIDITDKNFVPKTYEQIVEDEIKEEEEQKENEEGETVTVVIPPLEQVSEEVEVFTGDEHVEGGKCPDQTKIVFIYK